MPTRHPIAYEIIPDKIEEGSRWVTVNLKNIGDGPLAELGVQLHSMDEYSIAVVDEGNYVESLDPAEEVEIPFRISAELTGWVYVVIEGRKGEEQLGWESPGVRIRVGEPAAELVSVFALTAPYPSPGERLRCEATVRGLEPTGNLRLEFWAQQPSGEVKDLVTLENLRVSSGEERDYTTEITPEQKGEYVIHGYLYDDEERIGHATDTVYVGQAEAAPLERPELPPEE